MCKTLPKCYEKGYCYFCKKDECTHRVRKSGCVSLVSNMCDGNCDECREAVRSGFYSKLYTLKGFGENFRGCLMYHYVTEMQSFEFCGRVGMRNEYSKVELAILQLKKCSNCEERKKYFEILSEISSKIKEIPICFESMTDLTQSKALSLADSSISEVLEREFECKTKIVLKRLIKEYLTSNIEEDKIDLNKLCEYITLNQTGLDYYIHPLTVNAILDKF